MGKSIETFFTQINKNLSNNITSKIRLKSVDFLISLGRRAKGEATPKVNKIITLYNQSKIYQLQTAENIIIKLITAKTGKQQKSTLKQYEQLIEKHKNKEPLNKRLVEKKQIKKTAAKTIIKAFKKHLEPKIDFKNLNKAQNQIIFYLDHTSGYDTLNLTQLYPKLRIELLMRQENYWL